MSELGKWQIISFISRGMAMVIGLIQSFVIIRLFSVTEWGLVQLAVSVGGALGIYQHLGLASASTREISAAKNDSEVFKIFVTSVGVRYLVTLPIVIGLFVFADKLAIEVYKSSQLVAPLKLYAVSLFFQGFQSILNSVVSGTKRFKQLFTYQVAVSFISLLLYIPLVLTFKINGYFYAFLCFNVLNTFILTIIAFRPLKGKIILPSLADFKRLFKEIFSISIGIYLTKVIYTNWEKLGGTLLGLFNSPEVIAIYAFALLYAKKIMTVSDAVTDVNLPMLSEKYVNDLDDYISTFRRNFDKIFSFIILASTFASYWAAEIVKVLIGSSKYDTALPLIPILIIVFVLYSLINIVHASVFIPAKMVKAMTGSFILLLLLTIVIFYLLKGMVANDILMSWAMLVSAFVCFVAMIILTKRRLRFVFANHDHILVLIQAFFVGWVGNYMRSYIKLGLFPLFYGGLVWGLLIAKLITVPELLNYINRARRKVFS